MIKFLDLQKINEPYKNQFQEKLELILQKGWFVLGDEVKTFETSFAKYCKSKYCIGVGNGLDALVLIFKSYIQLGKLKKGDEVIVPANTYIASVLSIMHADLVPVLVEPDSKTYNIDPTLIQEKITSKTRAILVVHLYGQQAHMQLINAIAKQNNLLVIEDAAQAHGAIQSFPNSETDSDLALPFSEAPPLAARGASAYSFYPGKNLGALGDGGAVVTNDDELAKVLFSIRNYGSSKKYYNDFLGFNSRLDEIQAAFLNVKLPFLDADNEKRQEIANRYLSEIKNPKIILPTLSFPSNKKSHVFHLFVILTENRDELQQYLLYNGIETLIHYPVAPHKQNAFKEWNSLTFPITEKIHAQCISIPISPVMTPNEVNQIIKLLNKY